MKKIFIICTVRGASEEYKMMLENYVKNLESSGYAVHLPHRDTKQDARGLDICLQNGEAIYNSDEIHVFYNSKSQGTHFDMGFTFAIQTLHNMGLIANNQKIVVVENEKYGEGKCYARMLDEWAGNI